MIKNLFVLSTRALLLLTIFVLVGEGIVRIDQWFRPFAEKQEAIPVTVSQSEELRMVQQGTLPIEPSDIRILVLGDSYIWGGGIPSADKFSSVMRKQLQHAKALDGNVYVLDVSCPDNNAIDNYEAFESYLDRFQPTHVIVGHNLNDLPGNLAEAQRRIDDARLQETPQATMPLATRPVAKRSLVRRCIKTAYQLEVVRYASAQLQNQLKVEFGLTIPVGDFRYWVREAYAENSAAWQLTQRVYRQMADRLHAQGGTLYVYAFPEINLIERPKLFTQFNEALKTCFADMPGTEFFSGTDEFTGHSSEEYRLSKYDGHPNAKAHKKMVQSVLSRMLRGGGLDAWKKPNARPPLVGDLRPADNDQLARRQR